MNIWLNWRELEKHNDWGVRDKDDATAQMWNDGAAQWEERARREDLFNQKQVDALRITPDDTVIDICCGPGSLTKWIAPKAKHVTAFDFSENMLNYVREKAEKYDLNNLSYLQGNFNTMVPGVDGEIADIAVTRHSPAQGNILLFSKWARKRCYSLNAVYSGRVPDIRSREKSRWIRSAKENGGQLNLSERPDPRMYGFNIHFNLLYDMGANPEVNYVKDEVIIERPELKDIFSVFSSSANDDFYEIWKQRSADKLQRTDNGWRYVDRQVMSVLSWDPREIDFDRLN